MASTHVWKQMISIEIIPPRNLDNVTRYITRLGPLMSYTKQFSITCHEPNDVSLRGSESCDREFRISGFDRSLALARELKRIYPLTSILFHLTCHGLNKNNIAERLLALKHIGIQGLLVISGEGYKDLHKSTSSGSFCNSLDVVNYINQKHRGQFKMIAVAGYPDGHPDSPNYQEDMIDLRRKIDAGANSILTQCIYSLESYQKFLSELINIKMDINNDVSIRPSVCLYECLKDLQTFASVARVKPPETLVNLLSTNRNEDQVKDIAYRSCLELCKKLLESNIPMHISPINRFELTLNLLKDLKEMSSNGINPSS